MKQAHQIRRLTASPSAFICRKSVVHVWLVCVVQACCAFDVVAESAVKDAWFVISFDGKPVGYEQVKSHPVSGSQPTVISCFRKTQLNLRRLGQDLTVHASLWTDQTMDGQLLKFSLRRTDGSGSRLERSGSFDSQAGAYRITERILATRRVYDLRSRNPAYSPILSTWLPTFCLASPSRSTSPVFFPESATVSDIVSETKPSRRIRLPNQKPVEARRIVFYPQLDPTRRTTLYISDDSQALQQEKIILGGTLSIRRTTADAALGAVAGRSLDLDAMATIPINRLLSPASGRKQLILDLTVNDGFIADIPTATFQEVERINDATIRLVLSHPRAPEHRIERTSNNRHSALAATRWMPLEDPGLIRLAGFSAGSESRPAQICLQLAKSVHAKMRRSAFSTAISPANVIAKTLRGDCTEHAILLAALIRIKGIPSRIASGLVHTNQQLGFVGHTWVEALIGEEWIPFDSTRGAESLGSTYIKLADSEMPDSMTSGLTLFLPVLDLAGHASVRVVSDQ